MIYGAEQGEGGRGGGEEREVREEIIVIDRCMCVMPVRLRVEKCNPDV